MFGSVLTDEQYSQVTQVFMRETLRRFSGIAVKQLVNMLVMQPAPNSDAPADVSTSPVTSPEPLRQDWDEVPEPTPESVPSALKTQAVAAAMACRPPKKHYKSSHLKQEQKEEIKQEIIEVIRAQPAINTQMLESEIKRKFQDIGDSQIAMLIRDLRKNDVITTDGPGRPLRWLVIEDGPAA